MSRWLLMPLVLYALLFPVLAIDVAARLIETAKTHDIGNLTLLLFAESTRALPALCGIALAVVAIARAKRNQHATSLALFLLLGVIAFAMVFRGGGYVGHFQEDFTRSLLSAGMPRGALLLLFGYPLWPAWLAAAALIRFAVLFPTPLTATEVDQSGIHDRAGMLRGTPGAGVDVGQVARNTLRSALQSGWLNALPVWTVALFGAFVSVLLRRSPVQKLMWIPLLIGIGVAITALRARYVAGDADTRLRLRWIARGTLAALAVFAVAGIMSVGKSEGAAIAAFVLLTLAPTLLFGGLALALLRNKADAVEGER
jgi:hypothetical protein